VAFALTVAVAATAVGIEMLEALAIVLAVGIERRMRDALIGALAAVATVLVLGAAVGPALLSGADLGSLRVVIGVLLLLFGLEWLRKGVLRMGGVRRRSSSAYGIDCGASSLVTDHRGEHARGAPSL
jgi:Ca2+/H+ antiporter, TMEM165/GDT1 family